MDEKALLSLIQKALKDLQYGTVQLVVHEGKLVRVERTEKLRLPSDPEFILKPTGRSGG